MIDPIPAVVVLIALMLLGLGGGGSRSQLPQPSVLVMAAAPPTHESNIGAAVLGVLLIVLVVFGLLLQALQTTG